MISIEKYTTSAAVLRRRTYSYGVEDAVRAILADVQARGDAAVLDYTRRFDGADLERMEVTSAEMEAAWRQVDPELLRVMEASADNIRAFHRRQMRESFVITDRPGIVLGQRVIPLRRAGLYVPGGTAAYPSTVLMDAIPAALAGVEERIMATPPARDGSVSPVILAAARIAGVQRVFKMGGAQAIGALAYGTDSVPQVDKIVGPGNAYVAEAKKQVYGLVDIDMIAGPSEILVIADQNNNPRHLAADLLSQAEHDKLATAVLITDSEALAQGVQAEIERQLKELPREEIARASIENNGRIILVSSMTEAVDISNDLAPEHLELCVDDPFALLGRVRNAGSVFLGRNCPEALGDYFAGPNHTLPTAGTARFSSPLGVDDFVKRSAFTYYTREALRNVKGDIARFAESEGLRGHARSPLIRFEEDAP